MATYVGWLLHGVKGGIVAGVLFILPGVLAIFALSWLYVSLGDLAVAGFIGLFVFDLPFPLVVLGAGAIGYIVAKTMATVTFGGAYAVLAYVAQQGIENFQWLQPGEMLEGLGLAETTPGPLILVTQFVGVLAAYREAAIEPSIFMHHWGHC